LYAFGVENQDSPALAAGCRGAAGGVWLGIKSIEQSLLIDLF
jgi:hypothetical protein